MSSDLKSPPHVPVLLAEVLQYLAPESGGRTYVDATLGAGGHCEALLQQLSQSDPGGNGHVFGLDQDPVALQLAGERLQPFASRFTALRGNFSTLAERLPDTAKPLTGGILADIGVSSMQLDTGARGFSFQHEAPLDMRMAPDTPRTAADVVNQYSESELVRIFSDYGEEHASKTIARQIVARRAQQPFHTTTDLATLIREVYQRIGKQEHRIHPATRVFQALRIEVNDELGHLQRFLAQAPDLLAPGARLLIISFHSLEDRLVKQQFQLESRDCICPPRLPICQCAHRARLHILTRKPITASEAEIRLNPRARSARLRVAERM